MTADRQHGAAVASHVAGRPGTTLAVGLPAAIRSWLRTTKSEQPVPVVLVTEQAGLDWWAETSLDVGTVVDATERPASVTGDGDGRVVRPEARPDQTAVLSAALTALETAEGGLVVLDGLAPFVADDLQAAHRFVQLLGSTARTCGASLVVAADSRQVPDHVVTLFSYAVDEVLRLDDESGTE
jgi:hypothetical protein